MKFLKNLLRRASAPATVVAFCLCGASAVAQTSITLDDFNAGTASGSVDVNTSWNGNVTQNANSITVGGTARNDSGWADVHAPVNASAMKYVSITARLDPNHVAPVVMMTLEDPSLSTFTVVSVNSTAFAQGAFTTVLIPLSFAGGFDATQLSGWNIGGGDPSAPDAFRMTFDNLALTSGLSLSGGGTITVVGNQVYSSAQTLTTATVLNSFGTSGNDITFNSSINGAQDLTINTTGTATLAGPVGNITALASLTTDTGGTTQINGGSVTTTGAQTYNDTVSLGANTTFRALGSGIIHFFDEVVGNGFSLLIDSPNDVSFNRASGLSSFTKSGPGRLTLNEQSTYTGPTLVSAGTLALGQSNALASTSPLTLGGGTFALAGFSQTLGTLSLTASSTIDFGSGTSALIFASSSAQSWTGTLSLLNYTAAIDSLRFGSDSNGLTSTQLGQINFGGGRVALIDANGFVTPSAIPEPSTYAALAGAAALGLAMLRRRHPRQSDPHRRDART